MDELTVLQKTYDMFGYLYDSLRQYPKSEKHTLAADTKEAAVMLLRLLITANKRYHKKTTLQEADVQLELVRYYLRLGRDMNFLPFKRYEILAKATSEIGKLLGGWIKSSR